MPDVKVTLIHSRSKLLSSEPLPDEFKDRALHLVHEAGVETILDVRVVNTTENTTPGSDVLLSDGRRIRADLVINAVSKFHPTTKYLPSTALDDDGYVKIKPRWVHPHKHSFLDPLPGNIPNKSQNFAVCNSTVIFQMLIIITPLATLYPGPVLSVAVLLCIRGYTLPQIYIRRY